MRISSRHLLTMVMLILASNANAQFSRGTVIEGLTLESKLLKKEVRYTIYLPFDYQTSTRYYPVVYLLHGYTDNESGWLQYGEAHLAADAAIADREIPPMILVMPDAGVTWYINSHNGEALYEDFFIRELIPFIESKYRVRAQKRHRGVAGLSMGGYGALVYALKHPDLFSACAAFSAAVFTREEYITTDRWWDGNLGNLFGPELTGEARITPHLLANNPLHLVETGDVKKIRQVRFYIDCGDDDIFYKGNSTLHILLKDRDIPHEYRVRDGRHGWPYWRSGLVAGLRFIGASFHLE